jgi:acyl-CoA synthetase (AMP-forming)/AMP-acid ligase II
LQVSPSEIESILVVHPAIQDAAVVGIEDETYGELPGAFIVREPGTNMTEDEVKDYVACEYPFSETTSSYFYYYHQGNYGNMRVAQKAMPHIFFSVSIYS